MTNKGNYNRENNFFCIIVGLSLISMFFLGIFSEFFVRNQIINWQDPVLTLKNLQQFPLLFETGIFAFIFILLIDVLLSATFYFLFSDKKKFIAFLMVIFRLLYVAIKATAITGLFLALETSLSDNSGNPIDFYANAVMKSLKFHHKGFSVGLVFFGAHLIFLSILLLNVKSIPKLITYMLSFAGVGYIITSFAALSSQIPGDIINIIIYIFIIPMTFSELSLGLWLWVKRTKVFPETE